MSSETPIPKPSAFVWYELHTADAPASKAFYTAVLGWTTREDERGYTLLEVDRISIGGILAKTFAAGDRPMWIGYIGVDSIDLSSTRLIEAGGKILRPTEAIPNVGSFIVVADPQGAPFVLFEPPPVVVQPPRPKPGTLGTPAWHDLAAADGAAAFTFYAQMFGWTISSTMDMGPAGTYQIFQAEAGPTGGIMSSMDPSQKPGWLFYFYVEDIHAAVSRATQQGGTIVHGPSEVPGGQHIAHCLDPQGAIFGMCTPPPTP